MKINQRNVMGGWVLAVCLGMAACASVDKRRQSYVVDHPQLSVAVQNAIIHGRIIQGMGREEVEASIGRPVSTTLGTTGDGQPVTRWMYFQRVGKYVSVYEVRFVDNRVQEVVSDGYLTPRMAETYYGARIADE